MTAGHREQQPIGVPMQVDVGDQAVSRRVENRPQWSVRPRPPTWRRSRCPRQTAVRFPDCTWNSAAACRCIRRRRSPSPRSARVPVWQSLDQQQFFEVEQRIGQQRFTLERVILFQQGLPPPRTPPDCSDRIAAIACADGSLQTRPVARRNASCADSVSGKDCRRSSIAMAAGERRVSARERLLHPESVTGSRVSRTSRRSSRSETDSGPGRGLLRPAAQHGKQPWRIGPPVRDSRPASTADPTADRFVPTSSAAAMSHPRSRVRRAATDRSAADAVARHAEAHGTVRPDPVIDADPAGQPLVIARSV